MSQVRLYGNWLPASQRFTLRGLGWKGVLVVTGAYFAAILVLRYSVPGGLAILAVASMFVLAAGARVGGVSLTGWMAGAARWYWAHTTHATSHQAVGPKGWRLPGPLARTRMVRVETGGRAYGAVHDMVGRRLAVTLRVASTAADLNDDSELDAAVGRWERFLESLGRHPEVAGVVVVVETAPGADATLEAVMLNELDPAAPADCRTLMRSLLVASPAVAARTETRVTLVFDVAAWGAQLPREQRRRGIHGYLPILDRAVGGLESTLDGCGVTVLGRATAEELAAALRTAFDPTAAGDVDLALSRCPDDVPEWEVAGPVSAIERADAYLHDSGVSASFVWSSAPRQFVTSTTLEPLCRPGMFRKRVAASYVPTLAQDAMAAASSRLRGQRLTAAFSRLPVIGRAQTAQDEQDSRAADQAAHEVALGAGWVAQTISVTVTALDEGDLPAALAEVEQAAGRSQLRLRRLRQAQAAGFMAGLPAGLDLAELIRRWSR